jgi:hypothetical protein
MYVDDSCFDDDASALLRRPDHSWRSHRGKRVIIFQYHLLRDNCISQISSLMLMEQPLSVILACPPF